MYLCLEQILLSLDFFWVSIAHLQSQTKVGRLYNLTLVHFNPQKREFSLLLSILKHLADKLSEKN